jgi:hypothetical protein
MSTGRSMSTYDEERLGELLSALPPAPDRLVRAAKQLPLMREQVDKIVERADADDEYRRKVVADPEAALEEADVVAHSDAIEILRRKLDE